jgi:ribosomal protein S18 acetylase RimI-like enzyme
MSLQFPVESLSIRTATPSDVDWAAQLVFSAGPGLFSYVFATRPEEALEIFVRAFAVPNHAFSYEHTQILEVADRPAGLILAYPGTVKRKAEEHVQGVMAHIIPLQRVPRILVNLADLNRIKQDVKPDEYYILSLCIAPEYGGKGLGMALLRDAEAQARDYQCRSACIDVAYTNPAAQRWLQYMGYNITCSKTSHRFEHMTDAGGLHRMEHIL